MAKRLSDIADDIGFSSLERVKFESLVDKEITIEDIVHRDGDYGEYLILRFTYPDSPEAFSTAVGSTQIIEILSRVEDKKLLPVTVKVQSFPSKKYKGKNYYTIV